MSIAPYKPDRRRQDFMRNKGWSKRKPFHDSRLEELKQRMLRVDGWAACLPSPECEPHIEILLNRSQAFGGTDFMYAGQTSRCHTNSAVLALMVDELQMATGFAMSQDGVWRQHSWCCLEYGDNKFHILETTCPRERYYGVVLTYDEHIKFHDEENEYERQWTYEDYKDKLGFDLDRIIEAA